MVYFKYLVQALAIASLAAAQDDECEGTTVENQSDVSALSSCKTITGDLEIAPQYTNEFNLDGVEEITGAFKCDGGDNVTAISAPMLESIGDAFSLNGLTKLKNLRMDALTSVGSIEFVALPTLQNLDFGETISKAGTIRIVNTDLHSLDGINLEKTSGMDIANNPSLSSVNVNKITNATGLISFSANSEDLQIKFPNLQSADNMTFRNTSLVEVPSLETTKGLLGLYSNYFETFSAPNLTSSGALVFNDNSALNNISLPVLKNVDGPFQIANNSMLESFKGAPKLEEISGTLDFTGVFNEIELPALSEVGGRFNIQSSGDLDCKESGLDKLSESTEGKSACEGGVEDPQSVDPSGTSDGDDPSSTDAAGLNQPPVMMAMLSVLGGAIQFAL